MINKQKTIYLANPRGVCAGVIRAINIVEKALCEIGAPIFVRHQIVHNRFVIENFKSQGAIFAENLDEIPSASTVIFSAHGVAPDIIEKAHVLGLKTIDATCPIVRAIHKKAVDLKRNGWTIILIGHKSHPEIIGTIGHLRGSAIVVENEYDALHCQIPRDKEKITYLTQTTLSPDDVAPITAILKKHYKHLVEPERNNICYATLERQQAVREIAPFCDIFFVIGSMESSNSKRLREVAEQTGTNSLLINSYSEIDPSILKGINAIGLSAGASAPDILLEETISFLKRQGFMNIVDSKNDLKSEKKVKKCKTKH